MDLRRSISVFFLIVPALWFALDVAQGSNADEPAKAGADKKNITLTLKISDPISGLGLEAKKAVTTGTNAFDAMTAIVQVKYKTYPQLGPFVTGLCGVDAPSGMFWALYVDGKMSQVGIGSIVLQQDVVIEWKMQKAER
jgi:Domain of unknown function (DUF4430)